MSVNKPAEGTAFFLPAFRKGTEANVRCHHRPSEIGGSGQDFVIRQRSTLIGLGRKDIDATLRQLVRNGARDVDI